MKKELLIAAFLGTLVSLPAYAAPEKSMKEQMAESGNVAKENAKNTAKQAKKAGKDLADDVSNDAKAAKEKVKDMADTTGDAAQETAEDIAEDAEEMKDGAVDAAEDAAEAGKEEANKAVPPGMAKKDQHPSTGKGSEQGQESRNAEEKSWWNFWE